MLDAEDTFQLIRLADDLVYYDVPRTVADMMCAVSRSVKIEGKGIVRLNPRCSVSVQGYKFSNDRRMVYSEGDELIMLQREMSFAGLKDKRNASARSGVLPFTFTDWLLGDMMVVADHNDHEQSVVPACSCSLRSEGTKTLPQTGSEADSSVIHGCATSSP